MTQLSCRRPRECTPQRGHAREHKDEGEHMRESNLIVRLQKLCSIEFDWPRGQIYD
jgi:hypothetical protein